MSKKVKSIIILVVLFVVTLAIDLISKYVVCGITIDGTHITVIPKVLTFVYSENTGASFGMFGSNPLALKITTSVMCLVLIGVLIFLRNGHILMQSGLVCILSGAIGNLYDRIVFGYVRDFIDYTFIETITGKSFAICNFADLVLIVGTVLLIIYIIFFYEEHHKVTHPEAYSSIGVDTTKDITEDEVINENDNIKADEINLEHVTVKQEDSEAKTIVNPESVEITEENAKE